MLDTLERDLSALQEEERRSRNSQEIETRLREERRFLEEAQWGPRAIRIEANHPGQSAAMQFMQLCRDRPQGGGGNAVPPNWGLVIENGAVQDARYAEAIAHLLGNRILDVVVDTQAHRNQWNDYMRGTSGGKGGKGGGKGGTSSMIPEQRYKDLAQRGLVIAPLQYAHEHWNHGVGPHPHTGRMELSMGKPPSGAVHAVNVIDLTEEQRSAKLRERVWYPKLRNSLIFAKEECKHQYLNSLRRGDQPKRCIDLETFDITESSGRQQTGGAARGQKIQGGVPAGVAPEPQVHQKKIVELEREKAARVSRQAAIEKKEAEVKEKKEEVEEGRSSTVVAEEDYASTIQEVQECTDIDDQDRETLLAPYLGKKRPAQHEDGEGAATKRMKREEGRGTKRGRPEAGGRVVDNAGAVD